MRDDMSDLLGAFKNMRGSDRRAVLRRLTPQERTMLASLTAAKSASPAVQKPNAVELPPCSGWLAKRLTSILDEKRGPGLVTPAARDAVRSVLSEPSPGSNR